MIGIIQCILSFAALIVAWIIPKRIMWEQTYATLGYDYRSYDYAAAVQGITEFFVIDCQSKPENIREMYEKRFLKEVYGKKANVLCGKKTNEEIFKDIKTNNFISDVSSNDNSKILHFQRRLLGQFFADLDLCARSPFIGKRRVARDYTKRESDLIRILILIDNAIDESTILMKSLHCNEIIHSETHYKGMNKYLSHMYAILKNAKKYMEI